MNWETKNLLSDLEVLKDRFEDLKDSHCWHFDEHYPYETNHVLNKDEAIKEGFSYHERRIYNDQMFNLLHLYTQRFDEILKKFQEIEKTLPDNNSLATKSDNA
ncbi:DUF1474 family protein [Staphylococcus epidermidis]|nr:DUF1474 family protein [Staphylococcus epidermidis]MCG1895518.1 DUF1474 family protein [Staphylococcus epidermidis]MCG2012518.1 DUF1474 family protein [Staphylococcus epidermidis]MCG2041789.1 DUF1474 family protein [Staphylococcus epidermidis]MCG2079571.1 DUF1474 family protein [Staphylococcus epidermidis]